MKRLAPLCTPVALFLLLSTTIFAQCNLGPAGIGSLPSPQCTTYISEPVGPGLYFDLPTTASTYYDFLYSANACGNTSGMCITPNNGTGYTGNFSNISGEGGWYSGTCTSTRLSSFKTGNTNGCSTLLLYRYTTPVTPGFTTAPTTACQNTNSTFSVNVVTGATSYVWAVSGAGASITSGQGTPSVVVSFATAGTATVSVHATNNSLCNSATISTNVTIAGISIASSQTICSGSSTTQTATATGGTGTASYQWQSSPNKITWTNVGTNSATLSTGAITSTTYYRCIYSNSAGLACASITSNIDSISITSQPGILTQPASASICDGSVDNISVTMAGSGTYSYQWKYFNGAVFVNVANNTPAGVSYSNATSATMTISTTNVTTPVGSYQYQCLITPIAPCAAISTNTATLTVVAQPSISSQTLVDTVCNGNAGSLTVVAGGGNTLSYQWQYLNGSNYANVVNGTPAGITYTSPTAATMSIATTNGTTLTGNYKYRCLVSSTGACITDTSANSTLTVTPAAPAAPVLTGGTNLGCNSFTATWNAQTNATTYYVDVAYDGGFTQLLPGWNQTNVGNVTSVNVTGLTPWLPYYYRVRSVDHCAGAISGGDTVYTLPAAPNAPSDNSYYNFEYTQVPSSNDQQAFTIYGSGKPSFLEDFSVVSGTPNIYASGDITGVNAFEGNQYAITAVCNVAPDWSEGVQIMHKFVAGSTYTVTMAIRNIPYPPATSPNPIDIQFALLQSPLSSTFVPGEGCSPTPTLPSNAAVPYTITHYATNAWQVMTFTISGLTANYDELWIREQFSAGSPLVTTLFSFDSIVINQTSGNVQVATNVSCSSFTANWDTTENATGYYLDVSTSPTFSSFTGGYNNAGMGTNTSASISGLTPGTTYYYRVRATGACGTSPSSATVVVTLPSIPVITTQPDSAINVCRGDTAYATIVATGSPSLSYVWQYKNGATWAGLTNNTPAGFSYIGSTSAIISYATSATTTPGTYQFRCIVSTAAGCASDTSNVVNLSVNSTPAITVCPGGQTLNTNPSLCDATVYYPSAVVTGLPAPVVTYSQNTGTAFPLGITTVTVTATNACGTATCQFDVTVVDHQPPSIMCPGTQTLPLDASCAATLPDYTSLAITSDNCSTDGTGPNAIAVTQSPAPGYSLSGAGNTTVTLTATDSTGNSNSCSFDVMVVDTVAPVAICKAVSVYLDSSGNALVSASQVDNGSYDNCGIATLWVAPNTFTCGNTGANTATLTVTDVNGNTSSCTTIITVLDTTPPTAICQNLTVELDGNGMANITAANINSGSNDNCGVASMTVYPNSFTCSDIGDNTVLLTVTDNSGNFTTCSSIVTVQDNMAPVAICRDITVQLDSTGNVSVTPDQVNNGSHDNCGIASLTVSPNTFTCGNTGPNTVTLTVTDANGNVSTCTSTVTVQDNIAPTALCQPVTVQLGATGSVSVTADQVNNGSYDNCGVASTSISPNTFNCTNVGANTVTLTVTDINGNISTCTTTVTVQDNLAPSAVCQPVTVQLDSTGNATVSASQVNNGSYDNCTITSMAVSPNAFTCSNVGANTVTLTVTDASGNASTCTTTVTIQDNIAPTAICKPVTVQLDSSGNTSVTADQVNNGSYDNCGIASLAVSPNTFTCSNVGANTVTLTVTDVNGNISTCTTTVTVQDNIAPTAICQAVTVQLDASGNASVTAAQVNNGSHDNCGIGSLSVSPNTFTCSNVGANTVTLTVTDVNGNVSTCTTTVTVQDNVAPTTICKPVTVYLNSSGNVSITAAQVDNGSTDACGIASRSVSPSTFTCSNTGSNTVTLSVTDIHGNTGTCNATVTILDTVKPVAICKNASVTLNSSGSASITASQVNNGSYDNCGIASVTVSPSTFTCANIGGNTVTLTVTDLSGNVSTCQSTVTVSGQLPSCSITSTPSGLDILGSIGLGELTGTIFLGIGPQRFNLTSTVSGGSSFTYSWSGAGLSCYTCANPVFSPTAEGNYTLTLTVTNNYGCTSTCSVTICVIDARDGITANVYLCDPHANTTVSVNIALVAVYLLLHPDDHIGTCGSGCSDDKMLMIDGDGINANKQSTKDFDAQVYPNPFASNFRLNIQSSSNEEISVNIYDIAGKLIQEKTNFTPGTEIQLGEELADGVYLLHVKQGQSVRVLKIVKSE